MICSDRVRRQDLVLDLLIKYSNYPCSTVTYFLQIQSGKPPLSTICESTVFTYNENVFHAIFLQDLTAPRVMFHLPMTHRDVYLRVSHFMK